MMTNLPCVVNNVVDDDLATQISMKTAAMNGHELVIWGYYRFSNRMAKKEQQLGKNSVCVITAPPPPPPPPLSLSLSLLSLCMCVTHTHLFICHWVLFSQLITLSNLPISDRHYRSLSRCTKLGQFAMLGTCESWRDIVNSYVYYAHRTREIYQVLRYSVEFKAPRRLWNPLS